MPWWLWFLRTYLSVVMVQLQALMIDWLLRTYLSAFMVLLQAVMTVWFLRTYISMVMVLLHAMMTLVLNDICFSTHGPGTGPVLMNERHIIERLRSYSETIWNWFRCKSRIDSFQWSSLNYLNIDSELIQKQFKLIDSKVILFWSKSHIILKQSSINSE